METSKKKILVFIDWFLPGYKAGGPVRSMANMVDHLSDCFDFYIVTRNTEYLEIEPYRGIQSNVWVDFQPGVKVYYTSAEREGLRLWKQLIQAGNFDTIYINGIYSFKYSILSLWAAKQFSNLKVIVSPRGMLAPSAIGVKSLKKNLFLALVRLVRLYRGIEWHATNEKEASEIKMLCGNATKVSIAANLPRKTNLNQTPVQKQKGHLMVCSFARISPEKNTLFALQSLSLLQTTGEIHFHLYGQIYNDEYWQQCLSVIDQLPANIHVEYKGVVDADRVGEQMANYHVMYLPSRGENFGHVILESLMAGRPVLISDQTPWLGLSDKKAGWDLPLSEMPLFASKLDELNQMDQQQYDQWSMGARQLADQFINDPTRMHQYLQLFQ